MNPGEYSKNIKIKLDKQSGQLCFFDPTHPLARKNGMVTLGRHVLSVRLGRWLEPGEYALFMDGNPQNVDPENLQLTTLAEMVSHVRNRQVELVCPYCGEVFHVSKSHKDLERARERPFDAGDEGEQQPKTAGCIVKRCVASCIRASLRWTGTNSKRTSGKCRPPR